MQDKKSIFIASLLTLLSFTTIISNMLTGVPVTSIFIYLGGAIFYLLLVYLQKTGRRDRIDSIHTGEMAVLSLVMTPVILHVDNWFLLLLTLIPVAIALTWVAKNVIDPYSIEIFHAGFFINGIAVLIFLVIIFRWKIPPEIVMNILTGPLQTVNISISGFIVLYLILLILAIPASLLYPGFRLLTQGKTFYSSLREDFNSVYFASIIIESILIILTLMTIGILGSSVHWLIRNREDPLNIINSFLLIVIITQLFLIMSVHQTSILVILLSLVSSYTFFRMNQRKVYLW